MPPRGVKKGTKRARQYEHIKQSEREQGRSEGLAEEIAARTVNKERARAGESREGRALVPSSSRSCSGLAFPPLAISATRLPASCVAESKRRRERRCARRFDQVASRLDHGALRGADLVVADEDEVVEELPHDPLRQLERDTRREPFGERSHLVFDQRPAAPRSNAAGAASDCTPITRIAGSSVFATIAAPAAPLPPPTGTMIVSIRGSSSSTRASLSRRLRSAAARSPSGCSGSLLVGEPLGEFPRLVEVGAAWTRSRRRGPAWRRP